jgi:hypothetical protein
MSIARYQLSALTQKALKEKNLTADEVIRKALQIKPEGFDAGEGVIFPEGTVLFTYYKDRPYGVKVVEGALIFEDWSSLNSEGEFTSLSGAAAKVTGRPTTNGWDFWRTVKLPGKNDFFPMSNFRKS